MDYFYGFSAMRNILLLDPEGVNAKSYRTLTAEEAKTKAAASTVQYNYPRGIFDIYDAYDAYGYGSGYDSYGDDMMDFL